MCGLRHTIKNHYTFTATKDAIQSNKKCVDYDVQLRIITLLQLQKTPFNRIKNVQSFQPHWSKLDKVHVTHCRSTITCNKYMFTNIKKNNNNYYY
jgi:hypothetical protein